MSEKDNQIKFDSGDTVGVRVGHDRTVFGEHSEPIFSTSSYVFPNSEEAAMRFSGRCIVWVGGELCWHEVSQGLWQHLAG